MLINYQGVEYDCDDELSFRDFTHWEFFSRPEHVFDGKVIYASCFSQETPDTEIFPSVRESVFVKCNLSNAFLPVDATVIDCNRQRFAVQNDKNDWLIDETGDPVLPVNHKVFTKLGLPMPDPVDIPMEKVDEVIDLRAVAIAKKEGQ